ncbi:MAG: hypothetical protein REJ23_15190 [Brevundimonas sp.]|nr:hypothetical protein [Brevundimonas sp.]
MPRILLFLLTLLLAGCALPKVDPEREAQTDRAYAMVRSNDVTAIKADATPVLRQQDLTGPVSLMRSHVHPGEPTSARTLSWTMNTVNGIAAYEIVRLYSHPEGAIQVKAIMARSGDGPWQIDGLHVVRVTPETLEAYDASIEAARFSLTDKSPVHYLMLVAAGLSVAFCLVSAVVAGWRRRWLWMIGCLFGLGQVSVNWATGALAVHPIYVALLGAGFLKGLGATDPWIISVSLPLPAILFWALGKWRPKPPKAKPEAGPTSGPDARWADT